MNKIIKLIMLLMFVALAVFMSACDKQRDPSSSETTIDKPVGKTSVTSNAITDVEMGLSKTSVFGTPDPIIANYSETFPGSNTLLPRAYPGAPPQIPHNIESFKPITAKNNACFGCHHNPSMRGKEIAKGTPTPMSISHYTDLRHKPDAVAEQLISARYVCTQCHVAQANVDQLVENTFNSEAK